MFLNWHIPGLFLFIFVFTIQFFMKYVYLNTQIIVQHYYYTDQALTFMQYLVIIIILRECDRQSIERQLVSLMCDHL